MEQSPVNGHLTRREVLKWAAVGTASSRLALAQCTQAAGMSLRDKARKNLPLAIFTGVYGDHLPLAEAAKRISEDGFKGVVFTYNFKDMSFDPLAPDWDVLKKIVDTLEKHDLPIVGLFGYYNPIDLDPQRRKKGEARLELLARHWKRFGSPIISLETGTYNKESEFADDPKNWTEEGYQAVKNVFQRWAELAEKTGAIIAPEIYVRNVINGVERAARLLQDVNSPALKITMDPCNYYRNEDLPKMKPMLDEMFKRLGPQIVIGHAKDVKAAPDWPDLPAPGLGQLDYPKYLRLLAGLDRPMHLVVEHLALPDVPRARDFVLKQIDGLA